MQQYRKNLGKVSLTAEGAWNLNNSYDILSIVYDEHTQHGFISRKAVPKGVDLYNKEYWMPFNVSGYSDNNVIILSKKTSEASIQSYTLEEAITSIKSVGRRPGAILGFYNENSDRLDIGGRWELWQFNDTNIYNWENVDSWQNLYYNYNKFMGWFKDENFLNKYAPFPEIGCYAFVGSEFNEATVYRCDNKYVWNNTTQHVWNYIKVIVDGNVTVGENGNWFNNGVDTGIPASIKGENGKTPIIRNNNNILEVSYDKVNWEPISDEIAVWLRINNNKLEMTKNKSGGWEVISDYIAAWFRWQSDGGEQITSVGKIQITRDGVSWTDLSGNFVNHLRISKYIGVDESLPTSGIAEGTIYAKGPYYKADDTLQEHPAYRIWVYAWKNDTLAWQDNGEFTSITAGLVQETGENENAVMSQKAVTKHLKDLGEIVDNLEYIRVIMDSDNRILFAIDNDGKVIIPNANIYNLEQLSTKSINIENNKVTNEESIQWIYSILDSNGKIVFGIDVDGVLHVDNINLNVKEEKINLKESNFFSDSFTVRKDINVPVSLTSDKVFEVSSLEDLEDAVTYCNNVSNVCAILNKDIVLTKSLNIDSNNNFSLIGNGRTIISVTDTLDRVGCQNGYSFSDYEIGNVYEKYIVDNKYVLYTSKRTYSALSRMTDWGGNNFANEPIVASTNVKFLLPEELRGLKVSSEDKVYIKYTAQYKSYYAAVDKFEDGYCYFTIDASSTSTKLCPDADYYFQSKYSRVTFYNLHQDADSVFIRDNKIYYPAQYKSISFSKWKNSNRSEFVINSKEGNISFKDIKFVGSPASNAIISVGVAADLSTANVIVSNCTFDGTDTILYRNGDAKVYFINNISNRCEQYGVVGGHYVINNKFYYGNNSNDNFQCVKAMGSGEWYYANNYFENCNYISMSLSGIGVCEHNTMYYTLDYFNQAKDNNIMDGGAIYTGPYNSNVIIRYNTIINYVGRGINHGIYMDDGSDNFVILGNIIENVPRGYSIDARYTSPDRASNVNKIALYNILDNGIRFCGNPNIENNGCKLGHNLININHKNIDNYICDVQSETQYEESFDLYNGMIRSDLNLKVWNY